jgi:hypothetical protein
VYGVSSAHGLPAVSNCPRRRAAYLNPSGGKGQCGRGSGDWDAEAAERERAERLRLRREGRLAASACGSPGNRCHASRGPLRSDLIQARAGF